MSAFLEAALEYHSLGLHPIPVEPMGKRPILDTWEYYMDHQPTIEEITAWWSLEPNANVALVMGRGVIALDIDGPEGERALADNGIVIPADASMATTGKGRHVFFTIPGEAPNRTGVLEKVDTRGDGGYVVAPPSVHPSGRQYTWITHISQRGAMPPALALILARPTSPGQVALAESWVTQHLAGIAEGGRDVACTRLAGYFWGKGLPAEVVESLLQAWAARCTPPLPADQVSKCVESIVKREGGPEIDLAAALLTVDSLYTKAPSEHAWIWQDYLAEGGLAMLVAEEKAGKSTFFYALAAAVAKGKPFLQRPTRRTGVMILAVEESITDVKLRAQAFGMHPDDPVFFWVDDLPNTERTHAQIHDIVLEYGIRLVVLDTLGHYLAPILDSENDNLAVLKAVRPWLRLARDTQACMLLVHHTGKGGQRYRGASAFGGVVDQILNLDYGDGPGNHRSLWAKGRYRQTPRSIDLMLTGNEYYLLRERL